MNGNTAQALNNLNDNVKTICPSNRFTYYINYTCYFGEQPYLMSIIFAILTLFLIVLGIIMYRQSTRQVKQMTNPSSLPG